MSGRMPAALRLAALCGWVLGIGCLFATAIFWQQDRARAWEAPRWEPRAFERLLGPGRARPQPTGADTAETWVVAFHPLCRHCAGSVERVSRIAANDPARPRVVLLVIDSARPLAETAARRHPTLQVCWDARQVWRRHWGHRVYGEVLRFGPDGSYRGPLRWPDVAAR